MKNLFLLSICFITLFSCNSEPLTEAELLQRMKAGPSITGKVGEILIVCEQNIWESEVKTTLDSTLTRFIMPYFPDVATFELRHRTPQQFTHGFRRYRNLMFLNIDPNHKGNQASIKYEKDLYAYNQMTVTVTGNSKEQLLQAAKHGMDKVHDVFDEIEWRRLIETFDTQRGNQGQDLMNLIKEKYKISISLPVDTKLISEKDSFLSVTFPSAFRPLEFKRSGGAQEPGIIYSGIMFYTNPYVDSSSLSLETILKDRDSTLKKYVPGAVDGMYMGTQYVNFIYPEGTTAQNENGTITGTEVRGMFMFTGRAVHSTGGAFWSFSFHHPKLNKVLTISGFVEAPPTTSWTHFIRELEAVWKSVKFL